MYQHWNLLAIDRQAEQIKLRDDLIRQLWLLACSLFAIVLILAVMLIAATRVYGSEACMTKEQARAKWPTAHLWWHGADRCWDNQAGRGGGYGKRNPEQAKPHPAPPARADANGNDAASMYVRADEFNAIDAQAGQPVAPFIPATIPNASIDLRMLRPQASTQWPTLMELENPTAGWQTWNDRIGGQWQANDR